VNEEAEKLPTTVPSLVLCWRDHVNQSTNELSLVRYKKQECVARAERKTMGEKNVRWKR